MDIGEIRRQYKYAKDKNKCVSILADLNCCGTDKILSILQLAADDKKTSDFDEWQPTKEQKALMDRLDELDAMIKPLEDEYKRIAEALNRIFQNSANYRN